jgi:DNA-directed RNA polymerase subunit RPC12/RpoP
MADEPEKKPVKKVVAKPVAKPAAKPAGKAGAKKKPDWDPEKFLSFVCPRCKKRILGPIEFADRYMNCTECDNRVPVPKDQADADADAKAYEVTKMVYEVGETCVRCKAKMKKGAVICVSCGFDYREGRKHDVIDTTVKKGEKLRGKLALQVWIVELVVLLGLIGAAIFRGMEAEPIWWEMSLYLSGIFVMLVFLPNHFVQWLTFKDTPRREGPTVLEDDRAEREAVQSPLGYWTAVVFILCFVLGFAIGLPVWGGETFVWVKDTFFWLVDFLWYRFKLTVGLEEPAKE